MDRSAELINEPSYFFTEPWEPVVVRRGDFACARVSRNKP